MAELELQINQVMSGLETMAESLGVVVDRMNRLEDTQSSYSDLHDDDDVSFFFVMSSVFTSFFALNLCLNFPSIKRTMCYVYRNRPFIISQLTISLFFRATPTVMMKTGSKEIVNQEVPPTEVS